MRWRVRSRRVVRGKRQGEDGGRGGTACAGCRHSVCRVASGRLVGEPLCCAAACVRGRVWCVSLPCTGLLASVSFHKLSRHL